MIKILFTSVGRRVELIQAFREAALELDIELEVWGADLSNTAPALFFCNKTVQVCRIHDKEYIPQLLNICQQENINLLIPTIDTDLLLLAKNKDKFEKIGTKVLISDYDSIALCRDKRLTSKFFMECGLKTPETFDQVEKYVDRFPCFIKPKDGSSSINAFKVNDRQELIEYSKRIQDYIIQPFIKGKEYTVDICCDFEGKDIYLIPRERVAVRSGEVLKTKIIKDKQIELECEEIVRKFRPCGPITVQLIQEESTGDNYYIEINPRFGGGAPLSMKAGGNSAKVILELLSGKTVLQEKILIGNTYSRFDQSIVISEEKGKRQIERISEVETYLEDYDGIIFDLDDTLYSEKEYIRSGYHEIAKVMPQIVNCENRLWQHFQQGKQAINELLMEENCYTEENLKLCLDAYREQVPDIHLYDGIKELLYALKKKNKKIGIITDGRVNGQKRKLEILGLKDIVDEIIITDELAGNSEVKKFRKPNKISFEIMHIRFGIPYSKMVYVGDNKRKDFEAPKQLGMGYIYFKNKDGLYYCKDSSES